MTKKVYEPSAKTLNIHHPRPLGPGEEPFRATHLSDEQIIALRNRLARYKRRRQAAERGEDWRAVT